MAKITATGKWHGMKFTIIASDEDGELKLTEVDGNQYSLIDDHYDDCAEMMTPLGGTYYPEADSMLGAYTILTNDFFDELISIDVEGDIGTIPYEEGVIY